MSEEPASYMTPTAEAIALRQDLARAIARAEKAEARVKEQQSELSEQEVDKLTLLRELRESRAALHNATR